MHSSNMDSTEFSFLANGPQSNSTFRESRTFPEQSLSSINDVSTFSSFDLTPLDETQEDESRTSVSLDSVTALRMKNYQKALDLVKENAMLKEELNNVAPVSIWLEIKNKSGKSKSQPNIPSLNLS